jgi:multicomponent Na+:H+ antiporter subunit E
MSVPPLGSPGRRRRISVARLTVHAFGFTALWAILSEGEGWAVGVPVVFIATAASSLGTSSSRWSPAGLVRFLPYFVWNSLRGGVDVAARALNPRLPIDPAVLRYEMRLESIQARVLMADTVTLLPGTLSADLQGSVLVVHVLNASSPILELLGVLEQRVADLFRHDDKSRTR